MESQQNELLADFSGSILMLKLNRPEQRNALTFEMYQKISEFCQRAGTELDDKGIRAIVISATSKAEAAAYVELTVETNAGQQSFYGVGIDTSITMAPIRAMISALNKLPV